MRKEKIRETDYQQRERPKSRRAQFFDIAKHRFVEVLKLSLLQTVFNMPLIASLVLFYQLVRNVTNLNSMMTVFIITAGCIFISMISSFTGLTGMFYCFKKMAYAEGEYASSSYFVGLVANWKKGIAIGIIVGLSAALTIVGYFFFYYYLSSFNTAVAGFGIAIIVAQLLVVLIMGYYSIAQIVLYENSLRYILKNSFIFTLMRFHYNLPIFILHPSIIIALVVIMEITMYVSLLFIIVFIAFGGLMWSLNCISAFDTFINKDHYPDFYKKGLYKEA